MEERVEAAARISGETKTATCAECERVVASAAQTRAGAHLCAECVTAFYVACGACGGLLPRDEAQTRLDISLCVECFAAPVGAQGIGGEADIDSLVAEYVALHAEEKRIGERMEAIKERLKLVANAKQREGSNVTLRAGDAAVRCSFRVSLKCDVEAAEALSRVLDEEQFAALFERKLSFNPLRERVAEFLSGTDASQATAREALRAAVRETETVTLSVVANRK